MKGNHKFVINPTIEYSKILPGDCEEVLTTARPLRFIHDFETCDSPIYLATQIRNKGGSEPDIRRRISIAKEVLCRLIKIWKTHNIRNATNVRLLFTGVFLDCHIRLRMLNNDRSFPQPNRGIRNDKIL